MLCVLFTPRHWVLWICVPDWDAVTALDFFGAQWSNFGGAGFHPMVVVLKTVWNLRGSQLMCLAGTWPELVHMSWHKAVQSGQMHSSACGGEVMVPSAVPSEGLFYWPPALPAQVETFHRCLGNTTKPLLSRVWWISKLSCAGWLVVTLCRYFYLATPLT